jgi:hypothetical protein
MISLLVPLDGNLERPLLEAKARQAWGVFAQDYFGGDTKKFLEKIFLPRPLKSVFFSCQKISPGF